MAPQYCLVFGYGQLADGSLSPQTRDRCDKAVWLYREKYVSTILLTVSARHKNGKLMALAMGDYLQSQGIPLEKIAFYPYGGNTAGELDVFLKYLEEARRGDEENLRTLYLQIEPEEMVVDPKLPAKVSRVRLRENTFLVSTWYHCPRIKWLCWWRGLKCRVVPAWRYAHWKKDVLIEFLKLANAILRPFKCSKIVPQSAT